MVIYGTNVPDSIVGTDSHDAIRGWDASNPYSDDGPVSDHDTLRGAAGDDFILGGGGRDRLYGDDGNDLLDGGQQADRLRGGRGNDQLYASAGADTLLGGAGHDTLVASSWPDARSATLDGGAGNDVVSVSNLAASDLTGGTGTDLLILYNADEGPDSVFRLSIADPEVEQVLADGTRILGFEQLEYDRFGPGRDVITGGDLADVIDTGDGRDVVRGRGGDDRLTVRGFDATLFGGAGDDFIRGSIDGDATRSEQVFDGGAGNDVLQLYRGNMSFTYAFSLADPAVEQDLGDGTRIVGIEGIEFWSAAGNDSITGGLLSDTIYGGDGDDVLTGGAGNDRLFGDGGDNLLSGGDGDDLIGSGLGRDTVLGGAGNDVVFYREQGARNRIFGGPGQDLLDLGGYEASAGFNLDFTDPAAINLTPNGTRITGIERVAFAGSEFGDFVAGGALDDYFNGGVGNDTLQGGDGNDTFELYGTFGRDRILGNAGVDLLRLYDISSSGGQTLSIADPTAVQVLSNGTRFAGIEVLVFEGSDGNDSITGGTFNDSLFGNGGTDVLDGGDGDDDLGAWFGSATLLGGAGNDRLTGQSGGATVFDGRDGTDFLDLDDSGTATTGSVLSLADPSVTQILADGTTIVGIEQIHFDGTILADHVTGGALDDTLHGGGGRDTLFGAAGNDELSGWDETVRLHGGSGNDRLQGSLVGDFLFAGAGDDRVAGDEGDDLLSGGAGYDELWGGGGADRFVFTLAPSEGGIDGIGDFISGVDRIVLVRQAFGNPSYGQLPDDAFVLGTAAADQTDRFIYHAASGRLWFDADGTGATAQVQVLALIPLTDLVAADIQFI